MTSNDSGRRPFATPDRGRGPSLATVAKDAASDLVDLVVAQIRLARAELSAEVRTGVSRALRAAVFLPVVLGGYAFGMAALAAVLAPRLGWPLALAAVAGLQLVVGVWGVSWSLRRLARVRLLHRAADEVAETVRRIEDASSAVPEPSAPARGTKPGMAPEL